MKTQNAIIPFFALISAIPAFAGVPDAVTYAGTLNQGAAPANGTFTVVFDLFDAEQNGNRVYEQTEPSLAVSQGQLVVDLGDDPLNPLSDEILTAGPLFLDITVNGEELTPRIAFTAVPFARIAKEAEHAAKADDADTVGGLSTDDILNVFTADGGVQRVGDNFTLAAGGVTLQKMAASSVNSAAIVNASIISEDLANNAVTEFKIAADSVTAVRIKDKNITTAKLADGAVTAAKVNGLKVFVQPLGCGGALMLKRAVGQTKCSTNACAGTGATAARYQNCDSSCDTSATVAHICDVSDNDGDEIGLLIQK